MVAGELVCLVASVISFLLLMCSYAWQYLKGYRERVREAEKKIKAVDDAMLNVRHAFQLREEWMRTIRQRAESDAKLNAAQEDLIKEFEQYGYLTNSNGFIVRESNRRVIERRFNLVDKVSKGDPKDGSAW